MPINTRLPHEAKLHGDMVETRRNDAAGIHHRHTVVDRIHRTEARSGPKNVGNQQAGGRGRDGHRNLRGVGNGIGDGRAEVGHMPTGRQGNLIVTSSKTVSDAELRQMLIAEAKKQGKAYGLYFEDISSGFAVTTRRSPQAFQVIPLVVYRVYVDGRPDELVRGVSIVGTPQAALARIVATGNKAEVFNGICGAESGSVPVSAVAPAMLVSEIETQKQAQGNARPPILPPPTADNSAALGKVGGQ